MKATILGYLKTSAGKHVFFIALLIAGIMLGRSWLAEHDARLTADSAVKTAQTEIATLQQQQVTATQAAKVQVIALQSQAAAVKTAPQAIAALPTVSADLHAETIPAEALPDAPQKVAVDAVPLYQQLNECKQTAVNLNACEINLGFEKQINADKDTEISALKAKPGFWHRVKTTAITVGIGVAVGYVLHR